MSFTGAQFETFWYTLDGSEPVAGPPAEPPTQFGNSSTVFPLAEPTTVRVKAYRPFFSASADATAEFRSLSGATPTATPGGTYTESVTVSMASSTPAADIRYTLDGSEPTGTSPAYAGPLTLEATTTLKVKCFRGSFTPSADGDGALHHRSRAAVAVHRCTALRTRPRTRAQTSRSASNRPM
ncbi:MAG: chitobiase/beta-hexosaminidase C-terminal domain-containing protein [Caldilineaceae bacterium]